MKRDPARVRTARPDHGGEFPFACVTDGSDPTQPETPSSCCYGIPGATLQGFFREKQLSSCGLTSRQVVFSPERRARRYPGRGGAFCQKPSRPENQVPIHGSRPAAHLEAPGAGTKGHGASWEGVLDGNRDAEMAALRHLA